MYNQFKIDWNVYSADSYPYALYARASWWRRWKHIASFRTIEEAKQLHAKIMNTPVYL